MKARDVLIGGDVQLVPTYGPPLLAGARVRVLRVSARTAGLTVQLLEARGVYAAGDEIHVSCYEVEPIGTWRVMCRVSGGVTGERGPQPLKLRGLEQRYVDEVAARRAAENAQAAVSRFAAARFEYWPERVPE